jgi:hypothetical protein
LNPVGMCPTRTHKTLSDPPSITVGTPREYALWESRLRKFLVSMGRDANSLERVDARYNYRENRITIYRLADPERELSVLETLSHESLHAILYQLGEHVAARAIDRIGRPAGNPERVGGI